MRAHRPEMAAGFARNACRDHSAEQRTPEHQAAPLKHHSLYSPVDKHRAPLLSAGHRLGASGSTANFTAGLCADTEGDYNKLS